LNTPIEFINNFNFLLFILFALMYGYQIVYTFVAFWAKRKKRQEEKQGKKQNVPFNRYAVVISARNEELVIGQLIKSIKNQNYPQELIDVFVTADNCTDSTAEVARQAGAIVHERFNKQKVGKGYALNYTFKIIEDEYASKNYKGYFVFDADNLLDENYIAEMNKTFQEGYKAVTSYRNSKNFGQNWISSGYGLWFLHEAEYLNLPRKTLNTSCAISGTGFLVDADLIKENGGWNYHLLTEDIQFSVSQIIQGVKIGYCRNAHFYDEQPVTFSQSWTQRMRWAKGFYQVLGRHGKDLFRNIFKGKKNKFASFDMAMTIMPAMLLTCLTILVHGFYYFAIALGLFDYPTFILEATNSSALMTAAWFYGVLFIIASITTISEWNNIYCSNWKKIMYNFTFPIFMLTYIPIAVVALFKDVKWKPIHHTVSKSLDDVR